MSLSDWKLDRQTRRLIHKVIAKATRDQKRWTEGWDRSQLLTFGYSKLVVAKAVEFDSRRTWMPDNFLFYIWFFIIPYSRWWLLLAAAWLLMSIYGYYRCYKVRLSPADNRLVLEELTQKLGTDADESIEHPLLESWNRRLEKRALLWRLDRFLSRNPGSD